MSATNEERWKRVLEDMTECPKCGGRAGVYTKAVEVMSIYYDFGSADETRGDNVAVRGGRVFRCIECDKPLFDVDGGRR